jgi:hypothetical protein
MPAIGENTATGFLSVADTEKPDFGELATKNRTTEADESEGVRSESEAALIEEEVRLRQAQQMIAHSDRILLEGLKGITDPSRFEVDPYLKAIRFGGAFWFVFVFTAWVEILTIVLDIIEVVGSVTVILAILFQVLIWLLTILVVAVQWTYFTIHRVPGGRKGAGAGIRIAIAALIKAIPVVGPFIPVETIVLYLIRRKVNKGILKAKEAKAAQDEQVNMEAQQFKSQVDGQLVASLQVIGVTA